MTMLATSHDLHLLRIDSREDTLVRSSSEWVTGLVDEMHDQVEMRRNRERVIEICHVVDRLRKEVTRHVRTFNPLTPTVAMGTYSHKASCARPG